MPAGVAYDVLDENGIKSTMNPAALHVYNAVCQWLVRVKDHYDYASMRHDVLCLLRESGLNAIATWEEEYCHNEAIMDRAIFA